ncbi:MAG: hypothetical protein ACRC3J_05280 [Culicoidibacterales bacterium]
MIRLNNNFDGSWTVGDEIIYDLNELKTVLPDDETLEVCYNHVRYALYSTTEIILAKFDITIELLIKCEAIKPERVEVLALSINEEENKVFHFEEHN